MAARLISTALVITLVVCPYTCDVGCCASGERQNQCEAEPVFECCLKCGDDRSDDSPNATVPLQPQPEQKSPGQCSCICAGAIKQNGDVSASAVEMLRTAICPTAMIAHLPLILDAHGTRIPNPTGAALAHSGRALRTVIASLIC